MGPRLKYMGFTFVIFTFCMKSLLVYEEIVWDLVVDLLRVLPFGTKLPWHSSNGHGLIA